MRAGRALLRLPTAIKAQQVRGFAAHNHVSAFHIAALTMIISLAGCATQPVQRPQPSIESYRYMYKLMEMERNAWIDIAVECRNR